VLLLLLLLLLLQEGCKLLHLLHVLAGVLLVIRVPVAIVGVPAVAVSLPVGVCDLPLQREILQCPQLVSFCVNLQHIL